MKLKRTSLVIVVLMVMLVQFLMAYISGQDIQGHGITYTLLVLVVLLNISEKQ